MAGIAIGSGNRSPMEHAQTMLGKGQAPDRDALRDYMTTGGVNLDPKTAAWCAAFVNASLDRGGYKTNPTPLSALSFADYGERVDPGAERPGDIAVYRHGDTDKGHVGFYQGRDEHGNVRLLGGNQGREGRVTVGTMPPPGFGMELAGFRRPIVRDPTPQAPPQEAYRSEPASVAPTLTDYLTAKPQQTAPQAALPASPQAPTFTDWLTGVGGQSRGWFS